MGVFRREMQKNDHVCWGDDDQYLGNFLLIMGVFGDSHSCFLEYN